MFFSLVLSIVGLFNSASEDRKAIVEDYPFRLCYHVTAAMLFFFTSLLGVKDAFRKYIFEISSYSNRGGGRGGDAQLMYTSPSPALPPPIFLDLPPTL